VEDGKKFKSNNSLIYFIEIVDVRYDNFSNFYLAVADISVRNTFFQGHQEN